MFETGSVVAYKFNKDVTGVVKGIHCNRPMHRIICVKLSDGTITWFTPVELATRDDIDEYIQWLMSEASVPHVHEWVYDVLESNDPVNDENYINSINFGLTIYLRLKKEALYAKDAIST